MLNFAEILQTIKSLVETKIELIKSDIQDQLVGMLSRLILLVLIGSHKSLILTSCNVGLKLPVCGRCDSQFTRVQGPDGSITEIISGR